MKEFDPHQQQAPPSLDDERIAALLDGRLDEHARTELVARLADSDPDYRVFADAAAVLRDLEARDAVASPAAAAVAEPFPEPARQAEEAPPADPAPTPVIKLRRRWWGMPAPAWGAIAAGLVALALIPVIRARSGDPFDPARLASRMETRSQPRPDGWTAADTVFPIFRGGPSTSDIPDAARWARLGALLVDLEVAVRSGDTTAAPVARRVTTLLDDVPGAGSTASIYRRLGEQAGRRLVNAEEALKQGREGVRDMSDPDYFRAGAWTEAARLAAGSQDERFFRSRESRKGLQRLLSNSSLPKEQHAIAERVSASLPAKGSPNWPALQDELHSLLFKLVTADPDEVAPEPQASISHAAPAESDV